MWANNPPETALVGQDICTGITRQTVEAIVNNYSEIECERDLLVLGVTHIDSSNYKKIHKMNTTRCFQCFFKNEIFFSI